MAFPTWQAAGAFVEAIAGTISPAWPAHQAGDIGFLVVQHAEGDITLTTQSGFRPVDGGRMKACGGSTAHISLSVFWCRATSGAMAAPVVSHTGDHVRAFIFTIRGASATGLPWHKARQTRQESSVTALSANSFTTTESDALILGIIGFQRDAVSSANISGYTNANLANITERVDSSSTPGLGSGVAIWTGEKAAAGAVGVTTATAANAGFFAHLVLAITGEPHSAAAEKTPYLHGIGAIAKRGTAGTVLPAWPAHQADDIGILLVESGGWPVTAVDLQGFTELPVSPQAAGTSGTSGGTQLSVYWKRATGGAEAAPELNFIADHIIAQIVTLRECILTGNPWDVAYGSNNNGAPSTTVTMPSGTTTKPNCLAFQVFGHSQNQSNPNFMDGEPANADLTFTSETIENTNGDVGNGGGWVLMLGRKESAGSFTNTTSTIDSSNNQGRFSIMFPPVQGIEIEVEAGAFPFAGQALEFGKEIVIDPAAGAFPFAGPDMTLVIDNSFEINTEPGTFTVEGQEMELEKKFGRWSRRPGPGGNSWTPRTPPEDE